MSSCLDLTQFYGLCNLCFSKVVRTQIYVPFYFLLCELKVLSLSKSSTQTEHITN